MFQKRSFGEGYAWCRLIGAALVAAVVGGVWADVALPSMFKPLDWIQSNGRQHIDARYCPKAATPFVAEIRGGFMQMPTNLYQLFGALPFPDGHVRYDFGLHGKGCWTLGFAESEVRVDTAVHTLKGNFATGVLTVDGQTVATDKPQTQDSKSPFVLFARSEPRSGWTTCPASFRLFACTLTQGTVRVRDFVPCRNDIGEAGLWDKVEGVFFGNVSGQGGFAGSDCVDAKGQLLPRAFASPLEMEIGNSRVKRLVDCRDGHVRSACYRLVNGFNFVRAQSPEFSLCVNGKRYTGADTWKDVKWSTRAQAIGGEEATITCTEPNGTFSIQLTYTVYPDLPLVRKTLQVTNCGSADIKVEAVNVEDVELTFAGPIMQTMRQYGRYRVHGTYIGDWNDPLVVLHEVSRFRGLAVGNETVSVIKRTAVHEDGKSLRVGVTTPNQPYPFRRWLKSGQQWTSAAVFTAPYENERDPQAIVALAVQTYTRKYMGTRVEQLPKKPMFVYNTWIPFRTKINEKLICELADAAAECGVEEFVIDDGWQCNLADLKAGHSRPSRGDWLVDPKKFPRGLKPVFDHIKAKGMKPGLWFSLAYSDMSSEPFVKHPEWIVKGADDKNTNLHTYSRGPSTMCLGTDWYSHIRDAILRGVREYGLAYVKLDLAIATSAYVYEYEHAGCYAKNHPGHRDHAESFDVIYARCMDLFDELHREAPDLFIDCTYETAGKDQLMDYGIAKHAEGNWLSNIGERGADGCLRMRSYAWARCPALPATSLVIGNLKMSGPDHLLAYKSLTGVLPIMLGDPRQLTKAERAEYRAWSGWIKGLEARHGIMSFRQDLPGFGEPMEGQWDGFCRLNTETKSGGLVGIFRQGAAETTRRATARGLDPVARYTVSQAPDGKVVATLTGQELATVGFPVTLKNFYDGELFEIRRIDSAK